MCSCGKSAYEKVLLAPCWSDSNTGSVLFRKTVEIQSSHQDKTRAGLGPDPTPAVFQGIWATLRVALMMLMEARHIVICFTWIIYERSAQEQRGYAWKQYIDLSSFFLRCFLVVH